MIECPYCKHEQEDPEMYGDDETQDVECSECEKTFVVHSSVSISFDTRCKDGSHQRDPSSVNHALLTGLPGKVWCSHCRNIVKESDCEVT